MIALLALLAAPLLPAGTPAAVPGCARAASPVDKAVCGNPALASADAALNRAYARVRASMTPAARAQLLQQQRAWLARRNAECRTAGPRCLQAAYGRRNDELAALAASADTADAPLGDATPVILRGSWKASGIGDPASTAPADPAAAAGYLVDAGLPALGTTITAAPGRLCIAGRPCQPFGWAVTTIARVDGGPSMMRRFGLAAGQRVYVGSAGGPRSHVLLIPRGARALGAAFILCGRNHDNCRDALQIWSPAGADAAISPRP